MDGDWRDRGACRDADPELFAPTGPHDSRIQQAREVCTPCPVRTPCLEDALRFPDDHTVRAGTTATQRRDIRRSRREELSR